MDHITSVEQLLLFGISSVAGVVVFLWRQLSQLATTIREEMHAAQVRVEADLKECREDREALWRELAGRVKPQAPPG